MVENLRIAAIISLSIMLVVVLYRRYKVRVMAHELPAPLHAELLHVEVMYHPLRLRVHFSVPSDQEIMPAMLSEQHLPLHSWATVRVKKGEHVLELDLRHGRDGAYFFELATADQRTERRFNVRNA